MVPLGLRPRAGPRIDERPRAGMTMLLGEERCAAVGTGEEGGAAVATGEVGGAAVGTGEDVRTTVPSTCCEGGAVTGRDGKRVAVAGGSIWKRPIHP